MRQNEQTLNAVRETKVIASFVAPHEGSVAERFSMASTVLMKRGWLGAQESHLAHQQHARVEISAPKLSTKACRSWLQARWMILA